jgi:hypothetical protein
MRKNLITLLAFGLVAGLITGCGSDSSSTPVAPVNKTCVYSPTDAVYAALGSVYDTAGTATLDGVAVDNVVTNFADINTSNDKAVYTITYSSASCDNSGSRTVTIGSATVATTVTASNVLPF